MSVAREREIGTFDQLLVTPMRQIDILLGKGLPGLLIGVTRPTVSILAAVWWFEVPLRGGLAPLYLGLVLFVIAITGIGLMISSLAATQQQALLGAFLFLVPSIILSGFATPISNMPDLIQDITLINPMRYFLVVVRSVFLELADASSLWPQYWPMALIGMVNFCGGGLAVPQAIVLNGFASHAQRYPQVELPRKPMRLIAPVAAPPHWPRAHRARIAPSRRREPCKVAQDWSTHWWCFAQAAVRPGIRSVGRRAPR